MRTIKISPTLLNEWASLLNGDYEKWNKTEDDLREYILGEYKPNKATSKGSAVHAMVEHGPEQYYKIDTSNINEEQLSMFDPNIKEDRQSINAAYAGCDRLYEVYEPEFNHKWRFTEKAVVPIAKLSSQLHGNGVFETWNSIDLQIKGFNVRMNMRHDFLSGTDIHEIKTSKYAKKYDDYLRSFQKHAYFLGCPDANQIIYHCFQVPDENKAGQITWARYTWFQYNRTGEEERTIRYAASGLIDWLCESPELIERLTISKDS